MSEPSNLHIHTISFYGTEADPLMDFPFNFNFIYDLNNETKAIDIQNAIDKWLNDVPAGKTANWVVRVHILFFFTSNKNVIINRQEITTSQGTGRARVSSSPRRSIWFTCWCRACLSLTTARKSTWTTRSSPGSKLKIPKAAMLAPNITSDSHATRKGLHSNGMISLLLVFFIGMHPLKILKVFL